MRIGASDVLLSVFSSVKSPGPVTFNSAKMGRSEAGDEGMFHANFPFRHAAVGNQAAGEAERAPAVDILLASVAVVMGHGD